MGLLVFICNKKIDIYIYTVFHSLHQMFNVIKVLLVETIYQLLSQNFDESWLMIQIPKYHTDGSVQERRNTFANALEWRLSCTNPLIHLSLYLSAPCRQYHLVIRSFLYGAAWWTTHKCHPPEWNISHNYISLKGWSIICESKYHTKYLPWHCDLL